MFTPKLNLILLSQPTDTLNGYPSPVYSVLNVNWSAFLKGILPTLQSHNWNNGTIGGCQLGGGDLKLLPLLTRCLSDLVVWHGPLSVLQGCPNKGFFHLPPHPALPHCPSHPPPVSYTDIIKELQKYMKFSHQ